MWSIQYTNKLLYFVTQWYYWILFQETIDVCKQEREVRLNSVKLAVIISSESCQRCGSTTNTSTSTTNTSTSTRNTSSTPRAHNISFLNLYLQFRQQIPLLWKGTPPRKEPIWQTMLQILTLRREILMAGAFLVASYWPWHYLLEDWLATSITGWKEDQAQQDFAALLERVEDLVIMAFWTEIMFVYFKSAFLPFILKSFSSFILSVLQK